MNSANEPTNKDVFLNVRKAYRLLHDYQCMVRDAVCYIGAQLDIPYNGEWPRFCRGGGIDRDSAKLGGMSSWEFLPMIFCEYHFVKTLGDKEWLSLSFFIISDTGYIEGDENVNDKENTRAYAKAEKSATKFAYILRKSRWNEFPFMEDKMQMRNFIKTGGSLPEDLINAGFIGKCYDMPCLTSEEEATKIIKELIDIAEARSWPLDLKTK